ncbi:MAG: hypothetical protein QM802_17640 [Agriterribacter sp.]
MNKKLHIPFIAIITFSAYFLASCNGSDKRSDAGVDSTAVQTVVDQPDTVLFWTVDDYHKTKTAVYKDSVNITQPESVVNGIKTIYPNIHLKFDHLSNDTVYATIDSSFAFSNDMGTAGAAEYLSTVVLNLTTLQNVNFVNLNFPQGSHASPGVFAKSNYVNYQKKE